MADLDGDSKPDRVYELSGPAARDARGDRDEGDFRVGVCTANGVRDELALGAVEAFGITDIDGNGLDEIRAGGTSAAAGHVSFYALSDDRLQPIMLNDQLLQVTSGYEGRDPQEVSDWGCADVTGSASLELIQVETTWRRDVPATWRMWVYAIDGLRATLVRERSGEVGKVKDRGYESEDRMGATTDLTPGADSCEQ